VALASQQAQEPPGAAVSVRRAAERKKGSNTDSRRNRRPKVEEPEAGSAFVEWWKPGWRDRFR
jgi:hypothetical protein